MQSQRHKEMRHLKQKKLVFRKERAAESPRAHKSPETELIQFFRDRENNPTFLVSEKSHSLTDFQFLVPVLMRSGSFFFFFSDLIFLYIVFTMFHHPRLIWLMASCFLLLSTTEACNVIWTDITSWFSNLKNDDKWRPPSSSLHHFLY